MRNNSSLDSAKRILVISHLYPDDLNPAKGRFVADQLTAVEKSGGTAIVVSPSFVKLRIANPFNFVRACFRTFVLGALCARENGPRVEIFFACPAPRLGGGVQAIINALALLRLIGPIKARYGEIGLIHAHSSLIDGFAACAVAEVIGKKFLITEHTGPFSSQLRHPPSSLLLKAVFKRVARLVVVSRFQMTEVLRHFGNVAGLTRIIPNTIEDSIFRYSREDSCETARNENIRVAWVGFFSDNKRVSTLFRVFGRIRAIHPSARLALISVDDLPKEERQVIAEIGIAGAIDYIKSTDRTTISRELRKSHLLLVTSETETFSVACLESLAVGTPVVSTPCGGPDEMLTEEFIGEVVSEHSVDKLTAAALKYISNEHQSESARRKRATQVASRFSQTAVGKSYLALYNEIVGQR